MRVAKRALCLAAVSARGLLELEQMPSEQAAREQERLLEWVGELALEQELEQRELAVLQQKIGTLSQQSKVNATWRLEGLGVLTWALEHFELPVYDQVVDAGLVLPAVGFLDLSRAVAFLKEPQLRSSQQLRTVQDQCFALHWRLRNFHLDKKPMNFRKFAGECWFGPLDISSARFCDDDLAIGDESIGSAREEEFRKALSIASERHIAINWLVSGGEVYSETDNST
jgi:hypothetical protein